MHSTAHTFKANARTAMADPTLLKSLSGLKGGFRARRTASVAALPEFEALREQGRQLKDHVLDNLGPYLEAYEAKVTERGGHVHWAADAAEARQIVLDLCRSVNAKTVTKGKSMVAEEIGLNEHLEANGLVPVETDLGEYIIQLRHEPPSHIIAPAIHLRKEQVTETFREAHTHLAADRPLSEPRQLLDEARAIMRDNFFRADVGITGANLLIAETGSTMIVTNEGNGDLTQMLPKMHIVVTSIEKVVPTLNDAAIILRLLARSATGQETSTYTTFSTGPRTQGDPDGPDAYHVVLVDNGRSAMLNGPFREALRCIRCGACMNHCPVYGAVGGHAYGWVYPGPIGSVVTPAIIGIENAEPLPGASTLCGRCESVCPVKIPLPDLLRRWREEAADKKVDAATARWALAVWAFFATKPWLYRIVTRLAARSLRLLAGGSGRLGSLPGAGGWTASRDFPVPEGRTFMSQYKATRSSKPSQSQSSRPGA